MISCIIPSYNSEDHIYGVLVSLIKSAGCCNEAVEIIVSDNGSSDDTVSIAKGFASVKVVSCKKGGIGPNRNNGARYAKGDILVFTDDDNLVDPNFFNEISELAKDPNNAGGGCKNIKLTRKSLGIVLFVLCVYPKCRINHMGIGAFWVRRQVFDSIGGFVNEIGTLEDIDFAVRLKLFCNRRGLRYKNLASPYTWSTRKFDEKGDWYWVKNLFSFLRAVYTTKENKKALGFWYELP